MKTFIIAVLIFLYLLGEAWYCINYLSIDFEILINNTYICWLFVRIICFSIFLTWIENLYDKIRKR